MHQGVYGFEGLIFVEDLGEGEVDTRGDVALVENLLKPRIYDGHMLTARLVCSRCLNNIFKMSNLFVVKRELEIISIRLALAI